MFKESNGINKDMTAWKPQLIIRIRKEASTDYPFKMRKGQFLSQAMKDKRGKPTLPNSCHL